VLVTLPGQAPVIARGRGDHPSRRRPMSAIPVPDGASVCPLVLVRSRKPGIRLPPALAAAPVLAAVLLEPVARLVVWVSLLWQRLHRY
jgi:hypothetical protein